MSQLPDPRFGVCNLISGIWISSDPVLEAHNQGIHYMHNTLSFVNVVFDFAARKDSRHQLYKHVNAHVYLGVLAYITLNSVQAVVGDPHEHVDEPFAWHTFVFPDLGSPNRILRIAISSDPASGSTYSRYTYFVYGEKWPFGCAA